MALTKNIEVDLIEVVGLNIQVRTATIIKEDDVELNRSFHRHVLSPGADLANEDEKVRKIAEAIWP